MRFPRPGISVLLLSFLLSAISLAAGQDATPAPMTQRATPRSGVRPAIHWERFAYTCEGDQKLAVNLYNGTVKLIFQDHQYLMNQVPAADGARYSDGKVVWWSKGDGGFLQLDTPDGDGEMLAKGCKLDKLVDAVTGTISFLPHGALPPDAVVEVQLQDVTLPDAPPTVIAEEKTRLGKRQVPLLFELKFEPSKIDPQHIYSVRANILVDNQLRLTSEHLYRVLTGDNPWHVDINLKPLVATTPPPR